MLPHISSATIFSIKFYKIIPKESGFRQQGACLLGVILQGSANSDQNTRCRSSFIHAQYINESIRGFNDNGVKVVNKLRVKEVISWE